MKLEKGEREGKEDCGSGRGQQKIDDKYRVLRII